LLCIFVSISDDTYVFDSGEKPCGKIQFSVKYTDDQSYMGEKMGIFESLPEKEPLQIVREGASHSRNFCNCLDSNYKGLEFQAVESPYRDNR